MRLILVFLGLLALPFAGLWGQTISPSVNFADSTQTHVLILKDGQKLHGRALGFEDNALIFKPFLGGKLRIALADIEHLGLDATALDEAVAKDSARSESVFFREGPSHVGFSTTAFGRQRGSGEFHNNTILYSRLDYAFSDYFRAGASILGLSAFSLHAQLSGEIAPNLRLGYQARFILSPLVGPPIFMESNDRTIIYQNTGIITFGEPKAFANLAHGHFYDAKEHFGILAIGGGIAVSPRTLMVGELIVPVYGPKSYFEDWSIMMSAGMHYHWASTRLGVTGGFASCLDCADELPPLFRLAPIISVSGSTRF